MVRVFLYTYAQPCETCYNKQNAKGGAKPEGENRIMTYTTLTDPIEAVYIHIPFCVKKCNYCDFLSFSHGTSTTDAMKQYIHALIAEIKLATAQYRVQAKTIFVGGGTPSILPESLMQLLLEAIEQYFVFDCLQEYTVELNPGTITERKLQIMKQYGVNRLSIGVQSDNTEQLQLLGRIHTFEEAKEAVHLARMAGFDNINLDFMYGIPGQTVDAWADTLTNAMALKPQHLSLYQLKIEEDTILHQWLEDGRIEEFDDETALAMYRTAQTVLAREGYHQYEISNYAKAGYASLHNQVYWRTDAYLGLGLGACSWVRPNRWNNHFAMNDYLQSIAQGKLPAGEAEHLTVQEQMEETVFMALRMNAGLSKALFQDRFGCSVESIFADAIQTCKENQWLTEAEDCCLLTEEGRVLGNLVFMEFIREEA